VALVTGGAGMERSGNGLNWRSQAPKPADVSLKADSGDSSAVSIHPPPGQTLPIPGENELLDFIEPGLLLGDHYG